MSLKCPECETLFEAGRFCPDCGSKLVDATPPSPSPTEAKDSVANEVVKKATGHSFSEVGIIKGGDFRTEENTTINIYQGGTDPSGISRREFCGRCGKSLAQDAFLCRSCGKIHCDACHDRVTLQCVGCAQELLGKKKVLAGFERLRTAYDRLTLQVTDRIGKRNFCLISKQMLKIGRRDEANDLGIRVLPETEKNKLASNKISREHATIRFTDGGLEWSNLNCREGTEISGVQLKQNESTLLSNGCTICPARVVTLNCGLFAKEILDSESYQELSQTLGLGDFVEPLGRWQAMRLVRGDEFAAAEQYLVFQRDVRIGSSPACEIYLDDSSISSIQAQIVRMGESLWIETLQFDEKLVVNGKPVPPDHLVPLRPQMSFQLGNLEFSVLSFRQLHQSAAPPSH